MLLNNTLCNLECLYCFILFMFCWFCCSVLCFSIFAFFCVSAIFEFSVFFVYPWALLLSCYFFLSLHQVFSSIFLFCAYFCCFCLFLIFFCSFGMFFFFLSLHSHKKLCNNFCMCYTKKICEKNFYHQFYMYLKKSIVFFLYTTRICEKNFYHHFYMYLKNLTVFFCIHKKFVSKSVYHEIYMYMIFMCIDIYENIRIVLRCGFAIW